jgi:hypothetical protein
MASRAKNKITFARLARERKLRDRRQEKQAKNDVRKRATEMTQEPFTDTTQAGDQ